MYFVFDQKILVYLGCSNFLLGGFILIPFPLLTKILTFQFSFG